MNRRTLAAICAAAVLFAAGAADAQTTGTIKYGTGVLAALKTNVGSAGAPVLFNGAGGTPSSLTLTNALGLPLAGLPALPASNFYAGDGSGRPIAASLTGDAGCGTAAGGFITCTVTGIRGKAVDATAPTDGQVLQWSAAGSKYVPTTPSGAAATDIAVGTTTVSGTCPSGQNLTNNAGVVGCQANGAGTTTGVGVSAGQSPSDIGDNTTALPAGHYYYATNVAMTGQKTHPLPDSTTQGAGDLEIFDAQQTVTATNQLCVQAAGTDKINNITNGTVCITAPGGSLYLHNDGAGGYTTGATANIPAPGDGQLIVGKTGTPSNTLAAVTPSQDCTITNAGVVTCTKTNNVAFGALATVTPGANVATFLTTPSSANLAAALTDETGTGAAVFAGSPALTGTPTAPTATVGTNTTQLATTAFVIANASSGGGVTCPSTGSTVYTAVLGDCVNTQNASSSASLIWEIPTGYSHVRLTCDSILNSANVVDYIQFDEGSGLIGGTAYSWAGMYAALGGSSGADTAGSGVKGIRVAYNDNTGTTSFVATLQGLAGGSDHTVSSHETRKGSTSAAQGIETYSGFFSTDTTAVVKFALIPDSGTLTTAKCTARLDPLGP